MNTNEHRPLKRGDRYAHARSNRVVVIIDPVGTVRGMASVATVLADGTFGRTRDMKCANLFATATTPDGRKRTTGYVLESALKGASIVPLRDEDANLADLDTNALVGYIDMLDAEAKALGKKLDEAKEEARRRIRVSGTAIVDGVAFVTHKSKKFSAKLAKSLLSDEKLKAISIDTPNSTRAKALLSEEELAMVTEESEWTITVREATDKDFENAATGYNPFTGKAPTGDNVVDLSTYNAA